MAYNTKGAISISEFLSLPNRLRKVMAHCLEHHIRRDNEAMERARKGK